MASSICYSSYMQQLHSIAKTSSLSVIANRNSRRRVQEQSHEWNGLKFINGKRLLKDLSTWGIGGPCNYFVQVFDKNHLLSALRIEFLERTDDGVYRVGSGYRFNRLGIQCCNEGFTGLEFAGGIPVTVGGAAYINAGANGQKSRTARIRQQEYLERRRMSQPLRERSAGSVFMNPYGSKISAAELIDKAGLKGCRIGGAMISNIHANFFINAEDSTSCDMLDLIAFAKAKVDQKFGVQLQEEVLYVHPHSGILKPTDGRCKSNEITLQRE